jgi:hypothetical protein
MVQPPVSVRPPVVSTPGKGYRKGGAMKTKAKELALILELHGLS